jgi:hypothetical protein
MDPKVKIERGTFIKARLTIYLSDNDLSRAVSLIIRVLRPISTKTPKIAVMDKAREIIPKPLAPRYWPVYMVMKKPSTYVRIWDTNITPVFLAILCTVFMD